MELGDYLRELRELSGMKIRDVSEALEIPSVTLWAYEGGRKKPSEERILSLSGLYQVPSRVLLALAGYVPDAYTKVQEQMARNYLDSVLKNSARKIDETEN